MQNGITMEYGRETYFAPETNPGLRVKRQGGGRRRTHTRTHTITVEWSEFLPLDRFTLVRVCGVEFLFVFLVVFCQVEGRVKKIPMYTLLSEKMEEEKR